MLWLLTEWEQSTDEGHGDTEVKVAPEQVGIGIAAATPRAAGDGQQAKSVGIIQAKGHRHTEPNLDQRAHL